MAAIRIDARSRPSRQEMLEAEQYPDRGNTVMPSVVHEQARAVVRDVLVTRLGPDHFVAVELTLYLLRGDSGRFLIPDLLVTLDAGQADHATGHLRKSYRIWDEGPPDLVIELASPSTVTRDNVGKKEDYAAFGIREYVQFDPTRRVVRRIVGSDYLAPHLRPQVPRCVGVHRRFGCHRCGHCCSPMRYCLLSWDWTDRSKGCNPCLALPPSIS